jgi:hypothetical protein
MVVPRVGWVPSRARSLGSEAADWWCSHGGRLFEWQRHVLDGILSVGDDGRWSTSNDGLCMARQNGKGVVLQVIEGFAAFELGLPVVMHTAHEFPTSTEHQLRLMAFIQDSPALHGRVKDKGGYKTANGQESINLKSGARILFKARTNQGGRGYSGDLLIWDEAMKLPTSTVAAQKPMLRASQFPMGQKTIYAGSAVDQESHEHGVPFALIRERGLERNPAVCYFEWSAPYAHPGEMDYNVLSDRSWWPVANPSMPEGLISEAYMADEVDTMPTRTVAVELANVGDWPRTDGLERGVITAAAWDACLDEGSVLQPGFVLVFDVSPERHTTVAAVGFNEQGKFHAEVHEHRPGTRWLPARLAEMVERGNPDGVFCDGLGPSASMIKDCDAAGVTVEPIDTKDHTRSCGRLVDLIEEGNLAHLGSQELRDAVLGAAQRPVGDAWAWSRKNSSVNIAPLVAVTLGVGAAELVGKIQVF